MEVLYKKSISLRPISISLAEHVAMLTPRAYQPSNLLGVLKES